jgi:hypothetical protein
MKQSALHFEQIPKAVVEEIIAKKSGLPRKQSLRSQKNHTSRADERRPDARGTEKNG